MNRCLVWISFSQLAVVASLAASAAVAPEGAAAPAVMSCPGGAQSSDTEALRAALARDEQALEPRLKLTDALLAQGCYADAVHVLEEGERLHGRSGAIQSRLRDARTMLSEQRYFDGLDRSQLAAKTERNLLRCRKLADVAACDEVLRENPNDGSIVVAKADALVQSKRPAEALPLYRRAAGLDPSSADIDAKIAAAESQRQVLLSQCEQDNAEEALRACQLALLRGASDEFSIYRRKGILLQGMDEPSQALDSYIAASLLKTDDEAVSLAIVALTDSTGRKDALAVAARGNALLTLHRGTEAVQAFREAQSLSPGLPDIDARLAAAEELARREVRRTAAVAVEKKSEPAASQPAPALVEEDAAGSAGTAPVQQPDVRIAVQEGRTHSNVNPPSRSH